MATVLVHEHERATTVSRTDAALARVAGGARRLTRGQLRVFAMHDVSDLAAFERQVATLANWFTPVPAERVVRWFRGDCGLPTRAAWFTFDDGEPSTVIDAAPVLHRLAVPATVFVCPGLIDEGRAPWWEVVLRATEAGHPVELDGQVLSGQPAVTALKRVPDAQRRAVVDALAESVGGGSTRPVTVDDLRRWRERGGDIGNHTWDHPCLDRCDPADQVDQIDRAADWLDGHGLWDRRLFAYPNGDRTDHAEAHLIRSGYELVALFDHHLVRHRAGPHRVSRLRLDAAAAPERTAAVSSGAHSGLFSARDRARSLRDGAR
jgi:peptidoglycan/xylan/chitin deacetylase (PgdA/CDA1 family)